MGDIHQMGDTNQMDDIHQMGDIHKMGDMGVLQLWNYPPLLSKTHEYHPKLPFRPFFGKLFYDLIILMIYTFILDL